MPELPYLPDIYPNNVGDEARGDFAPLIDTYGDPADTLNVFLHGLGNMFKQIDDISSDGPNDEPGWSQIFDLERAKTTWLPWVAQMVGYPVPIQPADQTFEDYDELQRQRIISRSSWTRGTVARLRIEILDHLDENQFVIINERTGGDPYRINVWVHEDDIITSEAEIRKAALDQKLAGLLMEFTLLVGSSTSPGNDYETLRAYNSTYQEVKNKFADYSEVLADPTQGGPT